MIFFIPCPLILHLKNENFRLHFVYFVNDCRYSYLAKLNFSFSHNSLFHECLTVLTRQFTLILYEILHFVSTCKNIVTDSSELNIFHLNLIVYI